MSISKLFLSIKKKKQNTVHLSNVREHNLFKNTVLDASQMREQEIGKIK